MNSSIKNRFPSTINYLKEKRRALSNIYYNKCIYHSYFDDTQSIFIHNPKAAGTSIAKALYGADPRHIELLKFQKLNQAKFNKYFKFTFVRDPLTRIASAYFYCQKIVGSLDKKHPVKFVEKYESFEHFVLNGIDSSIKGHYFFGLQSNYLLDNKGSMDSMDFIGKFENLQSDFNYVANKLGIIVELGHAKKGEKRNYDDLFNSAICKKIKSVYEQDYRLLNY
jgi:chondroitin 4-sulfotransferase 11